MNTENNNLDTVENTDTIQEEKVIPVQPDDRPKKKKRKIGKFIYNLIVLILFVIVVAEVVVGIISYQKVLNNEEPIWYLDKKTTETELKTVKEYHLGLYKIVKTDTSKDTKTELKPFFIHD